MSRSASRHDQAVQAFVGGGPLGAKREGPSKDGPREFVGGFEPAGVYTCARSEGADGVVQDLDLHVARLKTGLAALWPGTRMIDDAQVAGACRAALRSMARLTEAGEPVLVTLFAHVADPSRGPDLYWHATAAPSAPSSVESVVVTALRTSRGNREDGEPLVKSSAWVHERVPLEEVKARVAEIAAKAEVPPLGHAPSEVLMLDRSGEGVLEGLICNVFVLLDDLTLQTAPSGVLDGVMRSRVIAAALATGIRLQMAAPRLADARAGRWLALLLTSVNKPAVPVRSVWLPEPGSGPEAAQFVLVRLPGHEVVDKLRRSITSIN